MSFRPWRTKQREGEPAEPSPLAGLRHEIDKLLDTYVREPLGSGEWPFGFPGKWAPAIEVVDAADAVVIRAELPGVDPNGLDVTATEGRVVIAGEKPQPDRPERAELCRGEIHYGVFRRSIALPEEVDLERLDATFRHGVLTLRVPRQSAGGAKKVHIKVAAETEEPSRQ